MKYLLCLKLSSLQSFRTLKHGPKTLKLVFFEFGLLTFKYKSKTMSYFSQEWQLLESNGKFDFLNKYKMNVHKFTTE